LSAHAGEQLLVTGPSGCGKSSLARCLAGVIPHLYKGQLEGEVYLDGLCTADTPLWQLTKKAGLVLQNPQAQMISSAAEDEIAFGLENLGLPDSEIGRRLDEMLHRLGIEHLRQRDPRRLSGGEGQRLMLAAVLARRPLVVVLDEPLSMLDTTAAEELVRYLAEMAAAGHAIVACEHRSGYFHNGRGIYKEHCLPGRDAACLKSATGDMPLGPMPAFHLGIQGLSVSFGQRCILENVNLELPGGKVVALIGPNGSGKTTLLRCLLGLQPHDGTVAATDADRLRLGLAYQNPDLQLFNPTVRQEILYGIRAPHADLYLWLVRSLGLESYEDSSPLLLSEGEKKRLCLAMIMMHMPRHGLLLDEPTLGQDNRHRVLLGETVKQLANAGRLVLVATHDLAWAAHYATDIVVLHEGRIMACGPAQSLLHDADLWQKVGLSVPAWIWEPLAC
jgi:energy-coupling factor transport system ATP-binding protein